MTKKTVLFLCTGNSARSQMAEAFLNKYAPDTFKAYSAGLNPGGINPYTIKVMEEVGISLDTHRSKSVQEFLGKTNFSHFVTVCTHAERNCPSAFLMSMGRHMFWDFEDPAAFEGSEEEKAEKFREIRNQIDNTIKQWLMEQSIRIET